MFDRLRQFIEDMTGPAPSEREFGEGELRLAAAALLVHLAEVDGFFAPSERRSLLQALQQRFDLGAEAAARLLAAAQKSDREAVDLYAFTSILKEAMDLEERRDLIEMMWTVAYADGEAQEFEENIIWRVSELLGVPTRDRIALRRKVRSAGGFDPESAGPWGAEPAEGKSA
jgi:uncharacterized tellurite resistance protein B-like protein